MKAAAVLVAAAALAGCGAWCFRVKGSAWGASASVTVCSDNRDAATKAAALLEPVDGGSRD